MTKTSDPDLFRAYSVFKEAWYASVDRERDDEVMVQLASTDGGVKWEFAIRAHALGADRSALRVEMFDDSWAAFEDCPDLFTALAALGEGAALSEVRDLLDGLGFRDTTARETPAGYAS